MLSTPVPNASCLNPFWYVPYDPVSCSVLLDFLDRMFGAEAQPSTQSGKIETDDDPLVRECLDMRRRSDGYLMHIEDRHQGKGGGLLLALKNTRRGLSVKIDLNEIEIENLANIPLIIETVLVDMTFADRVHWAASTSITATETGCTCRTLVVFLQCPQIMPVVIRVCVQ